MIKNAENKKQYAIEATRLLRVLSSGFKLTDVLVKSLGINPGSKEGINWAEDEEAGKIYVYKPSDDSGSVVGKNKTFTNTSFKSALLKAAGQAANFEVKGGVQVRFEVAEIPTTANGLSYFEVNFKEIVVAEEETEEAATKTEEVKSKAKKAKVNSEI